MPALRQAIKPMKEYKVKYQKNLERKIIERIPYEILEARLRSMLVNNKKYVNYKRLMDNKSEIVKLLRECEDAEQNLLYEKEIENIENQINSKKSLRKLFAIDFKEKLTINNILEIDKCITNNRTTYLAELDGVMIEVKDLVMAELNRDLRHRQENLKTKQIISESMNGFSTMLNDNNEKGKFNQMFTGNLEMDKNEMNVIRSSFLTFSDVQLQLLLENAIKLDQIQVVTNTNGVKDKVQTNKSNKGFSRKELYMKGTTQEYNTNMRNIKSDLFENDFNNEVDKERDDREIEGQVQSEVDYKEYESEEDCEALEEEDAYDDKEEIEFDYEENDIYCQMQEEKDEDGFDGICVTQNKNEEEELQNELDSYVQNIE